MDKAIPKCITYSESSKKDRSSPSEIYKAIESVLSFLRYRRELYHRHLKEPGCFTEFFFPVIVLDGLLFEARLEGEEVNLVEKDHIQLRTDYAEEIFIIDVVRKGNFENFFQSVEKDHLSFVKAINKLRCPKDFKTRLRRKMDQESKEFKLPFPPEFFEIEGTSNA